MTVADEQRDEFLAPGGTRLWRPTSSRENPLRYEAIVGHVMESRMERDEQSTS
jgi:hypothetical protein